MNIKTEQHHDSVELNNQAVPKEDTRHLTSSTKQHEDDFLSHYYKSIEKQKPRVEDTHTRDTYLIRNDLLERFNKLAKHEKKGFKMRLINYVLEKELNHIEKNRMGEQQT